MTAFGHYARCYDLLYRDKDYAAEARRWCEGVERFCRSEEVDYIRIDTAWTLERIVRAMILSGGVLR